MTSRPLATLPPTWLPALIDLERALAPIARRPRPFDLAARRWATTEPVLAGLDATTVFTGFGALNDAQARALIRVARTDDPDAELAGWALVWQFAPGLIGVARREARAVGSEGQRAAACTALAELWRQIKRIDLETNRASIFFALLARARRAAIPSVHGITPADRLVWSLVDPFDLGDGDGRPDELDADTAGGLGHGSGGAVRVLRQLRDPVAEGRDLHLDEAEWHATLATLAGSLADQLTEALVADLGWNPDHPRFEGRRARLRAYLQERVAGADDGQCPTAAEIAEVIDAPFQSVRDLHKTVNRAFRHSPDRYRQTVLASIDHATPSAA